MNIIPPNYTNLKFFSYGFLNWFSKFDFNLTRSERRRIIDEKYNPEYQIKVIQKAIDEK